MKLHWGTPTTLLSTVFVAVNVVSGQTIYTCPIEGSAGTVLPAETTIRIPIITNADALCTLVPITSPRVAHNVHRWHVPSPLVVHGRLVRDYSPTEQRRD